MRFLIIFLGTLLFANIGNITDIKGNVKIIRGQKTIKANINMAINKKDTIYTYNASKAKIVFKDKTIITIGKNSIFKIEDYLFGKKPKAKFNFLKGTFISLDGKIAKIAPKRFKLKTKNASIGIRGTIVFGEINNKKDTIGCSEGLISVSKDSKTILVKAGEMLHVSENEITQPVKIPTSYLIHIINNLSLKKNEVKTFFKKVYKNSNLQNQLSWSDYEKVENNNISNNVAVKDSENNLFFDSLKNKDIEKHYSSNNNDTGNNDDATTANTGSTNDNTANTNANPPVMEPTSPTTPTINGPIVPNSPTVTWPTVPNSPEYSPDGDKKHHSNNGNHYEWGRIF